MIRTWPPTIRGAYAAPLLIPGNYRVAATHDGFKRFTRGGIGLAVADNLQIDIKLEVGDVRQTVDVTDTAPLVDSADASLGVVVGHKEITE